MDNMPEMDIEHEYNTYDGMSRQAMIAGVPILPAFIILILMMFGTLSLIPMLGLRALAILLLGLPILVFLRILVKRDDQALRILGLEVYWWFKRKGSENFGNNFTITATKFGRDRDDYKRFVQKNDEAAAAARLFAASQSAHS